MSTSGDLTASKYATIAQTASAASKVYSDTSKAAADAASKSAGDVTGAISDGVTQVIGSVIDTVNDAASTATEAAATSESQAGIATDKATSASDSADAAQTAQTAAQAQVALATQQAGIGAAASLIYPTTAAAVNTGITGLLAGSLVGGSGGAAGTFALALPAPLAGGTQAVGTFTVASGAVTAINITTGGSRYLSQIALTNAAFAASAGLTGASASLSVGGGVDFNKYAYVPSTNAQGAYDVWQNVAGVATLTTTLPSLVAVTALQGMIASATGAPKHAFTDAFGFAFAEIGQDGTFRSGPIKVGTTTIENNQVKLAQETSSVPVIFRDFFGFQIFPFAATGAASSSAQTVPQLNAMCAALYDAKFSRRSVLNIARLDHDYNHVINYGQSLSNEATGGRDITGTAYDGSVSLGSSVIPSDTTIATFNPQGSNAFYPLVPHPDEDISGAYNWGMYTYCNAFKRLSNQWRGVQSDPNHILIASACGKGAISSADALKGSVHYSRMMDCISKAMALATAAGKTYQVFKMNLLFGENDTASGMAYATYLANILSIVNNFRTDVMALTGQTYPPSISMSVPSGHWTNDPNGPAKAIIDMGNTYDWISVPFTYYPLTDGWPDGTGVHPTGENYTQMGNKFAEFDHSVINLNRRMGPCQIIPSTAVYDSKALTLTVGVSTPSPPLQIKRSYVGFTAQDWDDHGFTISDSNGAIPATLTITESVMQWVLTRAAVSQITLAYSDVAHSGTGNIYDSDPYVCLDTYTYVSGGTAPDAANIAELVGLPFSMNNPLMPFSITVNAS